ncbi:hypothetical protein [uncultured Methanobrevibacter sp.]|uniref:hypothetical protein n=1 Tax=uncultured Methanobrevibacter sp. TaxID=253161 RepID=UPI0025E64F4C|nr:hypothetical protein [uncultured Methanobrevibacter sp.]
MIKYQLVRIMKKFFYPKATVDDLLTDKETIEIQKSQITDFPSSLPPAGHTHTTSEITDFPQTMTPTSHTHSKSEITDFPTSMTPTSHAHGSITNDGKITSNDASSAKKPVVIDSDNNIKTIDKLPFSKLNITKNNITGLGIPASDTNTTYTAGDGLTLTDTTFKHTNTGLTPVTTNALIKIKYDAQGHITGSANVSKNDIVALGIPATDTTYTAGTGLNLNGTTFNVHNAPATQLIHTVTNNCDFSNITGGTPLSVGSEVTQSGINELLDARLGEIFNSLEISSITLRNTDMSSGRFNNDSTITFRKMGKLVIMDYHLQGNSTFKKGSDIYVCNFPQGYVPTTNAAYSTWANATAHGQVKPVLTNGIYQIKIYCANADTSNMILGQLVYFTE